MYRYYGEYFDKETGQIYLRARYYDPEIGRFITEDSYEGEDQDSLSLNLYTYCENDPINLIDPSGHEAILLSYITEKNCGSYTYNSKTGVARITIGDITKEYKGQIINGMMVGESEIFAKDFGIDKHKHRLVVHEAADPFLSPTDAAIAWGLKYGQKAIDKGQEYGSTIYRFTKGKKTFYSFTYTYENGGSSCAVPLEYNIKEDIVADIHSHGNYNKGLGIYNERFSPDDINGPLGNETLKRNGFLVTPSGRLLFYNYKTMSIPTQTKIITKSMAYDKNDPNHGK